MIPENDNSSQPAERATEVASAGLFDGFHVTTEKKLARYRATGAILPPVRFWRFRSSAEAWAKKTGRTVILTIRLREGEAYPLPDHQPRGHAWWTPRLVHDFSPSNTQAEGPRDNESSQPN